jgi:RimJ/RimL family protein N-acetyltransferase
MTGAVTLRETLQADIPTFWEHQLDPVAVQMAAFTAKQPPDPQRFNAHWARLLGDEQVVKRSVLVDGAVAGLMVSWPQEGRREISYWLGRKYWGRGSATSALRMLLAEDLTRPLHARAALDNVGSIRVLQKCGFVIEAHERGFANARGEEIDEVVMVLREGQATPPSAGINSVPRGSYTFRGCRNMQ